jgi:hypothetical protein
MKRFSLALIAVLLTAALFVPPAFAAEGDDAWHFDLAPFYAWFVSIDGDVGIGPVTNPVAADFGDIFDKLDFVFTAHVEARKGNWGGIFDINYIDLGDDGQLPTGSTVDVSLQTTMLEFAGFYRITRDAHAFDLLAGLRYSDQETDISINPGPNGSVGADWWDPIVGGRWLWGFADGWQFVARGDIGGFGVGSDFSWNASGILVWQPWKHVSLAAGYKALDQDYEDGEGRDRYAFDATMHGPIAGINFRW